MTRAFIAITLCFLIAAGAIAQTGGNILKGTVTDETKAIIPGANVTATNEQGFKRSGVTNDGGEFDLGSLPVGKYRLIVAKEGFTTVEREITIDENLRSSDLTLAAGGIAEMVTVVLDSADAAVDATLKTGLSMHETPRSITTVGEVRMRDQNLKQVSDVLNFVPGTSQNSYRNGSYHFYSRGYRMGPEDTRVDGFSGVNVGSGGFGASLFGIEEAVVLRGPASMLYGQTGSPGGLINLVTKRPRDDRFTRIDLRTGGYSGRGVSLTEREMLGVDLDTTGPLVKSGRILYRGLVTVENMNYFTRDTLDRNRYANGSLLFKLDGDGRYVLTPSAQSTRYFRPYGGGIIASPSTSLSAGLTPASDPRNASINTDDLSPLDVNLFGGRRIEKTDWAGIDFRGVPTERIKLNAAYRFVAFDTDINSFTPQVSSNGQIAQLRDQFTVSRVQAKSLTERKYHNFNADASYEWIARPRFRNTTQVGYYTRILDSRTTSPQGPILAAQSPINIYTGMAASPLVDTFPAITFGAWGRDRVGNMFIHNRTAIGRLHFAVGVNFGWQQPATGEKRTSGAIPNVSILFNATPELAVYASYSTNFTPIDPNLEDINGNRAVFGPTVGKNYEVGTKYDLLNRRMSLTLALFQNQIDNALVQSDIGTLNPNNNRYYIPAGTRRARGIEFTGQFQVRHDLNVTAGAAFTSAIYKGFPAGSAVSSAPIPGSWAEKTPHFSYNIYTRYDRQEGTLKGFGAGLGIIYQGPRLGSNGARTFASPDPLVLPAFTRVDSALFYRVNRWLGFSLNVENMFDELVFVNGSVGSSLEIAAPRAVTLRTTFTF